jgi:hypothetical protein
MAFLNSTKGSLLRITSFTSSGTWTKSNDVGLVIVEVVGGGGGGCGTDNGGTVVNGTSGGSSSFGSHCSATGGLRSTSATAPGVGGVGSSGDINLNGGTGSIVNVQNAGPPGSGTSSGGSSFFGSGGQGGTSTTAFRSANVRGAGAAGGGAKGSGAGAGGYSKKIIDSTVLGSSETITVGAGGTGGTHGGGDGGSFGGAGAAGIVIVYEYSL